MGFGFQSISVGAREAYAVVVFCDCHPFLEGPGPAAAAAGRYEEAEAVGTE